MSTNNFAFENRCIVVEDDDFTFENVPKHLEYVKGSNRNYPSYYLDKYRNRFYTLDIVLTAAYYAGACIDYTQDDSYLDGIYFYDDNAENATDTIMDDFKEFSPDRNRIAGLSKQIGNAKMGDFTAFDELQAYLFSLEKSEADKILDQIKDDYGYTEVRKIANFCNGEALYEIIQNPQAV